MLINQGVTIGCDLDGVIRANNKYLGYGDLLPVQRTRRQLLALYHENNLPDYYYITSIEQVQFIPRALEALALLKKYDFPVYIITNQEAIGVGIMTESEWDRIRIYMHREIQANGGYVNDWFHCSHFPDENCECRKPKPGMFYKARDKYDIDLSQMYFIGDNPSDMQAGKSADCKCCIHIRLDNASPEFQTCDEADITVRDLHEAVIEILKREVSIVKNYGKGVCKNEI